MMKCILIGYITHTDANISRLKGLSEKAEGGGEGGYRNIRVLGGESL